ncbi:MAG: trehalase-like domain-containing protein [Acidimicrobiales bacterium]
MPEHPAADSLVASVASRHRPAIGAHRLLSDGRSTALILPDGEVDWWCAPTMDSPPLLWSLLDGEGAAARWVGVKAARWSSEPAPAVAPSTLRCGETRIECRDALVADGAGVALIRLVRSEGRCSRALPPPALRWLSGPGLSPPARPTTA